MQALKPFSVTDTSIKVMGRLQCEPEKLHLEFVLSDPNGLVQDGLVPLKANLWPRADELWKTTCFEAFFGFQGQPGYWEINLSPFKQSWNLYRFEKYREPQPPSRSNDLLLTSIEVSENTLNASFKSKIKLTSIEAALTAVIRTSAGVSYFALAHGSEKPDFHWRPGFTIKSNPF